MNKIKLILIHWADTFDSHVLGCRWIKVCMWVCNSTWWGSKECNCSSCKRTQDSVESIEAE